METATYVKICCPRCGGKDLNIIGDRDIGGSVVSGMGVSAFAGTKAGVIAGASGLQQKTYWICKKCGRKFRNPDELMAENHYPEYEKFEVQAIEIERRSK